MTASDMYGITRTPDGVLLEFFRPDGLPVARISLDVDACREITDALVDVLNTKGGPS